MTENGIENYGNDADMPFSADAEAAIIGSVLYDPQNVFPQVIERIKPEYFYVDQYRHLYNIMFRMFTSGEKTDIITVLNQAVSEKIFDTADEGRQFLKSIMEVVPTASNVASYCGIVESKYYIRSLSIAARDVLSEIYSGENDAEVLLDFAEQKIYDIRQGKNVRGLIPISDAVYEVYDRAGKMISKEGREEFAGSQTGFSLLDSTISGLNKSDLIIIAARPGMGKTSFALNIAQNVANKFYYANDDRQIVIFSLEMSADQLASRMLSSMAEVDSKNLRSGVNINFEKLADAAGELSKYRIYIDDSSATTVQQMKAKLRRLDNVGLVIIDYLQLMGSNQKTDNRVLIISEITRQMKILAKELNIPVILLSQLSRATESRTDKRPMLSDLRESGSIEQDADIVLFLYRDSYYNANAEDNEVCECIVAKNRHGETGNIKLRWDGRFTKFSELETRLTEE